LHSDREQLFPIHKKKEALCSSSIWKRRKFSNCILRWHSGSHAYSVGCYYYICMQGFLRPPNKEVALQFALLYLITYPVGLENDMEQKFCQSCGMPLTNEILGTNTDGTLNEDYCIYCYKDGKFAQDMTMEQMIDHCAQFTDEINKQSGQNLTQEQAKDMMRQFFPHLKRWKNRLVMFIAILTYKKPLSEVDNYLSAHREYLAKHYAIGDFITSGPQIPRIGGVIMIKANNREAVDAIISEDPFYINGIADYQIVEFTPTMFITEELKSMLL